MINTQYCIYKIYNFNYNFSKVFLFNAGTHFGKLPEIDSEMESKINYDEVWDEQSEAANTSDSYNRPTFESINMRQYTNIAPVRG